MQTITILKGTWDLMTYTVPNNLMYLGWLGCMLYPKLHSHYTQNHYGDKPLCSVLNCFPHKNIMSYEINDVCRVYFSETTWKMPSTLATKTTHTHKTSGNVNLLKLHYSILTLFPILNLLNVFCYHKYQRNYR